MTGTASARMQDGARRRIRPLALVAAAILASGGSGTSCPGQVILREGAGQIEGQVVEMGAGGVGVSLPGDHAKKLISLDRVKRIDGQGAAKTLETTLLMARAEPLWRARARIERGDMLGAEPLLESVAAEYVGSPGPTAAVVYEGLVRCRLSRGARAGAIGAWLGWRGVMERSGAIGAGGFALPSNWVGGSIAGTPVVDMRTGLAPTLPPIWLGEAAVAAAAQPGSGWDAGLDQRSPGAAELASWYSLAGQFEVAGSVDVSKWPAEQGAGEGVKLVRLIVQARTGDVNRRALAREGLRSLIALETTEPWEEAWCRAGIGRSLLRESDPADRIRGVLELMHVPARLQSAAPYLAGVCLAESAAAMAELNDAAAAGTLKAELVSRFPSHPAASWPRLASIAGPSKAAVSSQKTESSEPPKDSPAGRGG